MHRDSNPGTNCDHIVFNAERICFWKNCAPGSPIEQHLSHPSQPEETVKPS
jgi:hypothetical protein